MGTQAKNVYVFLGDNEFLKEDEQNKVLSRCLRGSDGLGVIELDGADAAFQDIETALLSQGMFSDSKVVRIRRVDKMSIGDQRRVADVLTNIADSTVVLLTATALDGRSYLMKTLKSIGIVKEFRNLYERDAVQWCRDRAKHHGVRLGHREAQLLVELVGTDLVRIEHELEKISLYLRESGALVTPDVVARVAGGGAEVVVFDLLDAIGERDGARAVTLLRRMLQAGEPPVKALFTIGRYVRDLLRAASMAESGLKRNEIIEKLGIHPYRAGKLVTQASNFSAKELATALQQILSSDLKVKSSELTPACWLEVVIHQICDPPA